MVALQLMNVGLGFLETLWQHILGVLAEALVQVVAVVPAHGHSPKRHSVTLQFKGLL